MLLKVSKSLLISNVLRFVFVKTCPIYIVQKVTEITKFIDFEIPSQRVMQTPVSL